MRHHDVLVLNKGWAPVHIITWQKAMALIYKEHAHAIDREFIAYTFEDWLQFSVSCKEEYQKVYTSSKAIIIPEIIVLILYNKLPQRDVKFSRQNVFTRDKDICQYCKKQFKRADLTIDHVKPRAQGGITTWDNIVAACIPCNARKGSKSLTEVRKRYPQDGSRWTLKKKPVKPAWYDPFSNITKKVHICTSWRHSMKKIDTTHELD